MFNAFSFSNISQRRELDDDTLKMYFLMKNIWMLTILHGSWYYVDKPFTGEMLTPPLPLSSRDRLAFHGHSVHWSEISSHPSSFLFIRLALTQPGSTRLAKERQETFNSASESTRPQRGSFLVYCKCEGRMYIIHQGILYGVKYIIDRGI